MSVTKSMFEPLQLGVWPRFSDDEIEAATRVLKSGQVNYWTGENGRLFESELALYFGVRHALTMANGTVALEAALRALGIGRGDEVIVTPRSYFASVGAVIKVGGRPVFADVDPVSQNITAQTIEEVVTPNTRALLPVHLAGWPCDMGAIMDLAQDYSLTVIEDCAQAHGAKWEGTAVGGFGQVSAFSFCQDKIITTGGEGGAVFTSDEALSKRLWSLREDGKKCLLPESQVRHDEFYYGRESIGSNLRMSEMQAAIGRLQLAKMDSWLNTRQANAERYSNALESCDLFRVTRPPEAARHAYYRYYVFIQPQRLRPDWTRSRLIAELRKLNVPVTTGSCSEIYLEPVIQTLGFAPQSRLPVARQLGEASLAFPVHPTLTEEQIDALLERVLHVANQAMTPKR